MTTDYCQCGHQFTVHDPSNTGGQCADCACTGYRNCGPQAPADPHTGGPDVPPAARPVPPAGPAPAAA